ncbi:UNVERIFIED_CONTAM: hypothetical protein Sangu_0837300 [Sesamum angustifolium]|uniref:Uncharacterized protein n=1 Tax=Sesamum angustifolium TaxID=2727405 RepID=A0AAW2PWM4_9LAMI
MNAQKDLKIICNRSKLKVNERRPNMMPKVVHTLMKDQKRRICEWICHLKFSDGYASNLALCVDLKELRMHVMESYDCHVFMQKLIPIAFGEMLPEHVRSTSSLANGESDDEYKEDNFDEDYETEED